MAVTNIVGHQHHHWIPSTVPLYGYIDIVDGNGVVYPVMDTYSGDESSNHCLSARFTKNLNDKVGRFDVTITNDYGRFLNKFDAGELVHFYGMYVIEGETPTKVKVFTGVIDDLKYGVNTSSGYYISLSGREAPELADTTVSGTYGAAKADYCLSNLLYDNYPTVNLLFWNGSDWAKATYNPSTDDVTWDKDVSNFPDTLINMQFQHKKTISTIGEIAKLAGLNTYLEYLKDDSEYDDGWYVCATVVDEVDSGGAISYGTNLISLSEYGDNKADLYNQVRVYGGQSDTIVILKTEDDLASQNNLWRREKVINSNVLKTMKSVEDKAKEELATGLMTTYNSRMKIMMSPFIKPGDLITVSLPYCGMEGKYSISTLTQTFGHPFTTDLELSRDSAMMPDLFIGKINPEEIISNVNNPNNMRDSYNLFFTETPSVIESSSNLLITIKDQENQIELAAGQTEGHFITKTLVTDYNVTECELRKRENDFTENDEYEVSNTNGMFWEPFTEWQIGSTHAFDIPDNRLKFKVTLKRDNATDPSPSYRAFALLYK